MTAIKTLKLAALASLSIICLSQASFAATGRTAGAGATNGTVKTETMAVTEDQKSKNANSMNDYTPAAGAETPSSEQSPQAIEPKSVQPKKAYRTVTGRTSGAGNSY